MASSNNFSIVHGAETREESTTTPRADVPARQETLASSTSGLQDGQPPSTTRDTPSSSPVAEPAAPSSTIKESIPSSSSPTNPLSVDQSSSFPQRDPQSTQPMSQPDSGSLELKISDPVIASSSSELPSPPAKESGDSGPSLVITLLLTTGAKHPFKLDGKYLRKRGVNVADYDPYAMSVYTLKELIWREWRSEWEPRPSSPSSIRLISFGKLLDDKTPLSASKFNPDTPNVVHMTIKPQEVVDEEDAKAAKGNFSRDRENGERTPTCRCVIL